MLKIGKVDAATTYNKLDKLEEIASKNKILNDAEKADVSDYIDKIKSDIVDYLHGEKDIEITDSELEENSTQNISDSETKPATQNKEISKFGWAKEIPRLHKKLKTDQYQNLKDYLDNAEKILKSDHSNWANWLSARENERNLNLSANANTIEANLRFLDSIEPTDERLKNLDEKAAKMLLSK